MSANVIPRPAETPYTTSQAGINATGTSTTFDGSKFTEIEAFFNVTAFAGTSIQFNLQALDAFGNWYNIASTNVLNGLAAVNFTAGRGTSTNSGFGTQCRIQWAVISSTSTFTVTVFGKY